MILNRFEDPKRRVPTVIATSRSRRACMSPEQARGKAVDKRAGQARRQLGLRCGCLRDGRLAPIGPVFLRLAAISLLCEHSSRPLEHPKKGRPSRTRRRGHPR